MAGKRIVPACILLLASALLFLLLGPGSGVKATTYDTTYVLTLSNSTPGAITDVLTTYNISVSDVNFGQILSATGYPEANIVLDSEVVDGSSIGQAINIATLSIYNGICTTPVTVTIPFSDCTTDTLKTAPWVGTGDNLVNDNDGDMNEDGSAASQGTGSCIDGRDSELGGSAVAESGSACDPGDIADDDGDGYINDGCLAKDAPETICDEWTCVNLAACDNDSDGEANDGCPKRGDGDGADNNDSDCINEATDNNGLPTYCDHYPAFLNDMFQDIRPRARYMGHQVVLAGSPATMLEFVIFNPEALSPLPTVQGQLSDTYGFVDFVVLDNPIAPVTPSSITDFCAPLTSIPTLLGTTDGSYTVTPGPEPYEATVAFCGNATDDDADGWADDGCLVKSTAGPYYERSRNPAPLTGLFGTGTHVVRTYSMSQRDADNDGISNNLDYFPQDATNTPPGGWPGANAPASCTATAGLPDFDQDCYPNRQDICPQTPDDQSDTDNPPGEEEAADLGPPLDAIGDACDNNPDTADGHFHVALALTAACVPSPYGADDTDGDGDSDDDDDGWCDSTEVLLGSCWEDPCTAFPGTPAANTSMPEHIALDLDIGTGTAAVAPGTCSDFTLYGHPDSGPIDNDKDGLTNAADPDCAAIAGDDDNDGVPNDLDNCPAEKNQEQVNSDGDTAGDECDTDDDNDGLNDAAETYMGTDPKDNAADHSSVNPDDANPFDFDQNTVVDVTDALLFLATFPSAATDPGDARFDYDGNRVVDVTDALLFLAQFPSDTKTAITFTNNTGQAIDDIYIYWKWPVVEATVRDQDGVTWDVSLGGNGADLDADRPDGQGDLANGKTVTVTVNARRGLKVRCYDWTLEGVIINSSPWPCRFHNTTGQPVDDIHYESQYKAYCATTKGPTWVVIPTAWPPKKQWDVNFPADLDPSQTVRRDPQIPSRTWKMDCWWWTDGGVRVGDIHGTCP